jgi:hypothetical protein
LHGKPLSTNAIRTETGRASQSGFRRKRPLTPQPQTRCIAAKKLI